MGGKGGHITGEGRWTGHCTCELDILRIEQISILASPDDREKTATQGHATDTCITYCEPALMLISVDAKEYFAP